MIMWWIPIIVISCVLIVTKHAMYRANEFSWDILAYAAVLIILAEIGFWKGLRLADSFFQPWFLGHVCLALFGLVASHILGDAALTARHYVGATMAVGAGFLLAT